MSSLLCIFIIFYDLLSVSQTEYRVLDKWITVNRMALVERNLAYESTSGDNVDSKVKHSEVFLFRLGMTQS